MTIEIPCPLCGSRLKLPDRSLLGKKGKCGKCKHRFILEDPAPTAPKIQFAEAKEATGGMNVNETLVGEFVQWIPEEGSAVPNRPAVPIPAPPPRRQVIVEPVAPAFPDFAAPAVSQSNPALDRFRKKKKGWGGTLLTLVVVLAVAGGGGYFAWEQSKKPTKITKRKTPPKAVARAASEDVDVETPGTPVDEERAKAKPVDLLMMPSGVEIVIHLRPAELWGSSKVLKDFRNATFGLADTLEAMIKSECKTPVGEIAELTIGLRPGVPGSPPDPCYVVRTVKDKKKSELISEFVDFEPEEIAGHSVYVGKTRAYIVKDPKTYAIGPADAKEDLIQSLDTPLMPRDELRDLLSGTNRKQLLTVAVINDTVYQHQEALFPEAKLRPMIVQLMDWCTGEVKASGWSFGLNDETFDSEILLQGTPGLSPRRLRREFEGKLESTPKDLLDMVMTTHPDTVGSWKLVGRFPAMVKAYAMSTEVLEAKSHLVLHTPLPSIAGPNLAAAAGFTWNATTKADFGTTREPASSSPSSGDDSSMTIAQRLHKKIEVIDFRDEMLYNAVAFIGDEIGVEFKLEGNDLKNAGVTQNMKQKFKLENIPATAVLDRMLTKLNLVIYVDEETKIVHITSAAAAKDRGWAPFPLTP